MYFVLFQKFYHYRFWGCVKCKGQISNVSFTNAIAVSSFGLPVVICTLSEIDEIKRFKRYSANAYSTNIILGATVVIFKGNSAKRVLIDLTRKTSDFRWFSSIFDVFHAFSKIGFSTKFIGQYRTNLFSS